MKPEAHRQFETLEGDHWWFRARRRVYLDLLRTALGSRPVERILDVGAGSGGFLPELSSLGGAVHYAEPRVHSVAACRERGFPYGVRARAEALPYAEMSFDLVCLFDVLEHAEDDAAVLGEVARVLRPEGLLLVTVPAYPWLWSENDEIAEHRRRYTRDSLRRVIEAASLGPLRCTHTNALLLPAIAAYLLIGKGAGRLGLRGRSRGRTNLEVPVPRVVDRLCYHAFTAELKLSRRWNLPVGHSILALARRRDILLTPAERSGRRARGRAAVEGSLAGL